MDSRVKTFVAEQIGRRSAGVGAQISATAAALRNIAGQLRSNQVTRGGAVAAGGFTLGLSAARVLKAGAARRGLVSAQMLGDARTVVSEPGATLETSAKIPAATIEGIRASG